MRLTLLIVFCSSVLFAQENSIQSIAADTLKEVVIEATRADEKTPMPFTNVSKEELEKLNFGQDLPYLLRYTPSLVVTSDAGNGIGYTGLWIRGSDPSRVNVTINGVPLNDPESQQVFWVDVPDLAGSTNQIQIQRGVGTSTNGAGAFGGSIKIETTGFHSQPYVEFDNTIGSFNTVKNTVSFGTGLIRNHFALDGKLSRISSDGYIDRAATDLKSFFLSGSFVGTNTTVKALAFGGHERTYQSWYGTPAARIEDDEEAMRTHAANNSYSEEQLQNLLTSGRTYNYYLYENEVDDYTQNNYQLHITHRLPAGFSSNATAHYTKGKGYFEQYRPNDAFGNYNLENILLNESLVYSDDTTATGAPFSNQYASQYGWDEVSVTQEAVLDENGNPVLDANGNTLLAASAQISESDVVRRRWLDNQFFGGIVSLQYKRQHTESVLGLGWNEYMGNHFGELTWMEHANKSFVGDNYYRGTSNKKDAHAFIKTTSTIFNKYDLFLDLQVRSVIYKTKGTDNDLREYEVDQQLLFFNPKAGVSCRLNERHRLYASIALANKEPNRNDFVDAILPGEIKHESLRDVELGYQWKQSAFALQLNLFHMQYRNQLVLTGALNDVGAPLRTNVDKSFRRGIELQLRTTFLQRFHFNGNLTLSQHRINSYDEVMYDYTTGFDEIHTTYSNTPIALSPQLISSTMLDFDFFRKPVTDSFMDEIWIMPTSASVNSSQLTASWGVRYVGSQYLDNTGDKTKTIAAYLVNDFRISFSWATKKGPGIQLSLLVNNALNRMYSANGYTYSYIYGEKVEERFYYPQAGRNFLVGLTVKV